ncbi:MAG TPA: lamin tail domain-containing protein, partial [Verrucomicrobiae bacterium]|nr:lamin tail domain-containing protein [Verrucomicrobiae bacterium]
HNWDGYSFERGKNAYTYKPNNGRFVQWTWDIDFALGIDRGINPNLFGSNDPRIVAMWQVPAIRRAYLRAFQDLVDGPWRTSVLLPLLDAKDKALRENNVTTDATQLNAIKNYISGEINQLTTTAAQGNAPFEVTVPTSITTNNNLIVITGTAPIKIKDILLNGQVIPVTWSGPNATTPTIWRVLLVAQPGQNVYNFTGNDSQDKPVAGAGATVTVNFTGPAVDPVDTVVFSEIMYNPTTPNASFVEIHNRSSNFSFDLSGWEINGLNFTFPVGTILTNGQYLVVAKNLGAFSGAYAGNVNVAGEFDGNLDLDGETLTLVKPGANGGAALEVDKVRYEPGAPWNTNANGNGPSLQLIDAAQDNSRSSNWSDGSGWRFFSYTGVAGSGGTRLFFWLTNVGDVFIDDIELVKGSAPGAGPNIVQNGGFETG